MGGTTSTVIATTKLAVPGLRRSLVGRPDLVARLDAPDYRLAVVAAPAGYGKTATMASWASRQDRQLAWLSCDLADVEPTRFMAGLLASLATTWPGVADDASVLLEREGANTVDAAVAVANELASIDGPGVIVVDDLHLARPSPDVLTAFVDALPDHVRLVIGSRSDLPISLARFRVQGGLLELRSDDLRFSAAHTAEFCRLRELSLDVHETDALHQLTEGWPAGAQLAALALQRSPDRAKFFDDFARTDRAVGDFLLSEVLDKLPPDLVEFLVDTSVLDTFDADLCAAVSGHDDAAQLLERMIAADLFVVALDDRGSWSRYHHLFGAFLRARLASLGETRGRVAHSRASVALEARGDVTGALRHTMAIDDIGQVGWVLQRAMNRDMSMSDADVTAQAIRSWLHEFGAALVESDPVRVVEFLVGLISIAGPDDAVWWLRRVEEAHPAPPADLAALVHGAWAELHLYHGESGAAIARATACIDAVDGRPPNTGLLPLAFTPLARAHLQAGNTEALRTTIARATVHPSGNAVADGVRLGGLDALLAATDGWLGRALQQADDVTVRANGLQLAIREPGRIWSGLARAEVLIERNELVAAAAVLGEVVAGAEATHRAPMQSLVALQQARLARALDDPVAAEAHLVRAGLLLSNPDDAARAVLGVEAVQQALRFEPSRAAALIDALDPDRVETRVLMAKLLLIDAQPREAAGVLADLAPAVQLRLRVERSVLVALTLLDIDVERANDHLGAALTAARPERLIRTIVDPGPDVHKLLLSCTADASLQPYIEQLIGASSRRVAPSRAAPVRTLVEPLTRASSRCCATCAAG